jgi:Zn-finger protein
MVDYRREHIKRLIEATNDLYKQPGSICHKCHHIRGSMNCMLCYCPYYFTECEGNYKILDNGIKDCSGCNIPHRKQFVEDYLMDKLAGP